MIHQNTKKNNHFMFFMKVHYYKEEKEIHILGISRKWKGGKSKILMEKKNESGQVL